MDEKGFRQLAVEALAWLREYPQRAAGLGLFFLGCLLAALVRGGGDPLRDFASGTALGLGVGCMAVGPCSWPCPCGISDTLLPVTVMA